MQIKLPELPGRSHEENYTDGPHAGLFRVFLASAFCVLSYTAASQVRGRVVDVVSKEPLSGAYIMDDEGNSAVTGSDGTFTLQTGSGKIQTLTVRYTGYHEKEVKTENYQKDLFIELEPEYKNLGEVVVTAPAFTTRLNQSSGAMGILPADRIGENNGVSLAGSLNSLPGVYMASGTYSTNRLIIRGIGSRNPYSTNRIRAYFGDIPLTSGDGTSTVEDIDASAVSRIEVIRGPASAMYGSGLGGIIKIFPWYPSEHGLHTEVNSETGSFQTYRNWIKSSFSSNRFSVSSLYSNTQTSGYRENSRYSRNSVYLTANIPGRKKDFTFLLTYTGIHALIPSSLDRQTFLTHPENAAQNWLDIRGFEDDRRLLAGITMNQYFTKRWSNKLTVFSSFGHHYESRPFNILSDHSASAGFRELLRFQPGRIRYDAGAEMYSENYDWQIYQTIAGKQGTLQNRNAENRSYVNIFSHAEVHFTENFRFESGINLNLLRYAVKDKITNEPELTRNYTYQPVVSPYAGINYSPSEDVFIYFSVGHGFSAPSLEETLLPNGDINPRLKPEQGWNFDLGLRGHLISGFVYSDFCLYFLKLNDLLVTKRLSEDTFIGINAGKTQQYGFESFLKMNLLSRQTSPLHSLVLTSSFTISENRFLSFNDNGTDFSGKLLPGIPMAMLNLDAILKTAVGLGLFTGFSFTGSQYMNDLNTLKYGSYKTIDLKLTWDKSWSGILKGMQLYAGIRNLFNERYASMILVNAQALGGSAPRYYYPGEPVNFYAGMKIKI